MTREERIAELEFQINNFAVVSGSITAGARLKENMKIILTELRAADEELKKLRTATGVDMVYEQLALANRQLIEINEAYDKAHKQWHLDCEMVEVLKTNLKIRDRELAEVINNQDESRWAYWRKRAGEMTALYDSAVNKLVFMNGNVVQTNQILSKLDIPERITRLEKELTQMTARHDAAVEKLEVAKVALNSIEHDRGTTAGNSNAKNYHVAREALRRLEGEP